MALRLHVIVVGGGIGGLSCAIALRRAGHRVTVFEKHNSDSDGGAGIVIRKNATQVLESWGLRPETRGAVKYHQGLIVHGRFLNILKELYLEDSPGDVAQQNMSWSNLRGLLNGEVERGFKGQGSITMRYGKEVVQFDVERPAVRLADGSWHEADFVVACDGIKSRAVQSIVGVVSPGTPTGYSCFRMRVSNDKLQDLVDLFPGNDLIASQVQQGSERVWSAIEDPGKIFVWWTCETSQVHCFDIVIRDNDRYQLRDEWRVGCDKRILFEEFRGWHPVFRRLLEVSEDPLLWKICDRAPLEVLYRGRLCMLGDALHPMGPYRAQGGSMTIEDAGALEICFTGLQDRSEIPIRLQALQRLRVPRYATCQLASSIRQDEPNMEQRFREVLNTCRNWFDGQDQSHLANRAAFSHWLDNYDVKQHATIMLSGLGF